MILPLNVVIPPAYVLYFGIQLIILNRVKFVSNRKKHAGSLRKLPEKIKKRKKKKGKKKNKSKKENSSLDSETIAISWFSISSQSAE